MVTGFFIVLKKVCQVCQLAKHALANRARVLCRSKPAHALASRLFYAKLYLLKCAKCASKKKRLAHPFSLTLARLFSKVCQVCQHIGYTQNNFNNFNFILIIYKTNFKNRIELILIVFYKL